jgi:anti-anti-sigma factor
MATPLRLGIDRRDDGTLVLQATGELDLSNIGTFSQELADALTKASTDGGTVTVDLSRVEYLDSGAINALFARANHIRLIANPILMPVLKISGLTDVAQVEAASPSADH